MVIVSFEKRIFFDFWFIEWALKTDKRKTILYKLLYINASSKGKTQCLFFKDDYNKVITDLNCDEDLVKSAGKRIILDDFGLPNEENDISRNLVFVNLLVSQEPFKAYIFTSEEKKKLYEENNRFKGVSSISILEGDDVEKVVENYYRLTGRKNLPFNSNL